MEIPYRTALIVGAGSGISASVARGLASVGLQVGLAARNTEKLAPLVAETHARTFAVDASDPAAVARLFEDADRWLGEPDVVLYNASARAHGPIAELDPEAVRKAIEITAFGGFLTVREAARRMIPRGRGAILLTGASASIKRYPLSAAPCYGQICIARSSAEHGARTGTERHPYRPFRHRQRRARRATSRSAGPPGQHAPFRCDRADL
jgi:NAD(P)-dependent dehydrogenase (short-subunit alcohol dehydrogenase family)